MTSTAAIRRPAPWWVTGLSVLSVATTLFLTSFTIFVAILFNARWTAMGIAMSVAFVVIPMTGTTICAVQFRRAWERGAAWQGVGWAAMPLCVALIFYRTQTT